MMDGCVSGRRATTARGTFAPIGLDILSLIASTAAARGCFARSFAGFTRTHAGGRRGRDTGS